MNEQILSIEEMQEVKDLDIDTSKASMIWEYKGSSENRNFYNLDILDYDNDLIAKEDIPTFTLQDILEMLPNYSIIHDKYINDLDRYEIRVNILKEQHYTHITQSFKSLLEAAFKMLKWCKQNGDI